MLNYISLLFFNCLLWLEDVRLLVVYCQLLISVKLMEVPVKNWICINHYICWITNTRHTLFTYFNTPPYSCIYKLCNTVAVQCRQFTSRLLVLLNLLYTRGGKEFMNKGWSSEFLFFLNWPSSSTLTLHYMGGRNLPPLGFWTLEPSILIWGAPDYGTIHIL